MRLSILTIMLMIAAAANAWAADDYPEKSEFEMVVMINTDPSGADLYAVTEKDGVEVKKPIGTTPYAAVVAFTWDRRFFRKDWKRINVWSTGNIASGVLTSRRGEWEIYINVLAEKPGCEPMQINEKVASLARPGYGWAGKDEWPDRKSLVMPLAAAPKKSEVKARPAATPVPTVLIAKKKGEGEIDTGIILISSSEDQASVVVDSEFAGYAPLKIVLPTGIHDLRVRKDGFEPVAIQVNVKADSMFTIPVKLSPGK